MTVLLLSAADPLDHVVQHPYVRVGPLTVLSNHIVMQLLAALLLVVVIPWAVRQRAGADRIGRLVPRGLGNAIEAVCLALRRHVAEPAIGPYTDTFMPFIWSVFFFVLTCNLLGMVPLSDWTRPLLGELTGGHGVGGTPTGNIWVTGTLAGISLTMIVANGLRLHGVGYLKHFFIGPFPVNLLIGVLEMVGLLAKTFALAVRLFANMVAGHVLLAVLLTFIGMAAQVSSLLALLVVAPLVVLGSVALNFLELFVAFLQAFIFTFLTAVFIGQAVNIHHEEHAEAHPAAAPGAAHAA